MIKYIMNSLISVDQHPVNKEVKVASHSGHGSSFFNLGSEKYEKNGQIYS